MTQTIIRSAEQEEDLHPDHQLYFVRDVVVAATGAGLSLQRGRIEPGGEIVGHCHEQNLTVYILSGDVTCYLGEEENLLGAGSCVVVGAGIVHGFKNCGDKPVEMILVFVPPAQ